MLHLETALWADDAPDSRAEPDTRVARAGRGTAIRQWRRHHDKRDLATARAVAFDKGAADPDNPGHQGASQWIGLH